MYIHGWCERCKRFKRVRVSGAGMVSLLRGVVTGVCQECEEAKR